MYMSAETGVRLILVNYESSRLRTNAIGCDAWSHLPLTCHWRH